jgi:hypothetical protein
MGPSKKVESILFAAFGRRHGLFCQTLLLALFTWLEDEGSSIVVLEAYLA